MDITEALEVADRWRNERVIVVGNNALPYAAVALADAYKEQAAELERLQAGMKAIHAAANNTGAAESRLSACKQIAAESIGEG